MSTTQASDNRRPTAPILIADGDADTRTVYRDLLRTVGRDVMEAADGREALVKALLHTPVLVITETHLGMFDGYALCEVLRHDSVTRTVPIFVVTTETRSEELDRARRAGADAVLIKPVAPDAFLREVQRLVEPIGAASRGADRPLPSTSRRPVSASMDARSRAMATPLPTPPAALRCPSCDRPLTFERSHVGGIRHVAQWDVYRCPASCGSFEFRPGPRKLRHVG